MNTPKIAQIRSRERERERDSVCLTIDITTMIALKRNLFSTFTDVLIFTDKERTIMNAPKIAQIRSREREGGRKLLFT